MDSYVTNVLDVVLDGLAAQRAKRAFKKNFKISTISGF